jgi:DNA-binding HxlR family transcriptional regulator
MTKRRKNPGIAPDIFYDLDFCPVRSTYSKLSGKWVVLILTHLNFGTHRFSELLAAIPDISQRMLTQSVRLLERDGFVSRKVTASVPPRVDYSITEFGRDYLEELESILHWSLKNRAKIAANQRDYDEMQNDRPAKRNSR